MQIYYSKTALKHIKNLDSHVKGRVQKGIEKLPFGDIKKMEGHSNLYRLRIGDYRVLYSTYEDEIYIEDVMPRGDVYKRL